MADTWMRLAEAERVGFGITIPKIVAPDAPKNQPMNRSKSQRKLQKGNK